MTTMTMTIEEIRATMTVEVKTTEVLLIRSFTTDIVGGKGFKVEIVRMQDTDGYGIIVLQRDGDAGRDHFHDGYSVLDDAYPLTLDTAYRAIYRLRAMFMSWGHRFYS